MSNPIEERGFDGVMRRGSKCGQLRGNACDPENFFLPLYLSAQRSGLYNNSFDYNCLQEKNFAEIYRILLKFIELSRI